MSFMPTHLVWYHTSQSSHSMALWFELTFLPHKPHGNLAILGPGLSWMSPESNNTIDTDSLVNEYAVDLLLNMFQRGLLYNKYRSLIWPPFWGLELRFDKIWNKLTGVQV